MNDMEFVRRRVLRDDVIEYIIEAIFNESYKPGDRLVETRISRELEVSQGAVREAIRDLSARGVLETEPYKGARVKKLSADALNDYYKIRLELEVLALRMATENNLVSGEAFENLEMAVGKLKQSRADENIIAMRRADIDFHRSLVMLSGNSFLCNSWDSLGNEFWAFVGSKSINDLPSEEKYVGMHYELLNGVKSADVENMRKILEAHFLIAQDQ